MLRLKRLTSVLQNPRNLIPTQFVQSPSQWTSRRFLDIYQLASKTAIEKERARLSDELNRGYFADIDEMKKHGGKIAAANKIIIPAITAVKFPEFDVNYSNGSTLKLPVSSTIKDEKLVIPKASLLCLSFRASSQAMIDSWSVPFLNEYMDSNDLHLFEVSFIDSWLLTRSPVKKFVLRIMRKSNFDDMKSALQRQVVYSFGDHFYFRKELKILNLLTGYVFLLDKYGRIRWQGSGSATPEELGSLLACTSVLLEEA